ncbi:MAG TPA: hypothetical protein VNH18_03415 [Bryobacteraceae bacterium]|nr:hypothetical protein [Bryobacteraceae bacterium]
MGRFADRGAEQRPLAVAPYARSGDVRVEISLQLVMARHFVHPTVFFVKPQAPPFLLRIVILDGERDDGPDAGEAVRHHCNDGAVAQADYG